MLIGLIISFVLNVLVLFILFRLNKYIGKLETIYIEARDRIENLTQSFKNVLVDEHYLLDHNKLKKDLFQAEKPLIYNGVNTNKKIKENSK